MLYVRATLAAGILAAAFFLGAAQAQTIGCTGPTGGNCVPTVPFTAAGAINAANPLPVAGGASSGTPITGNATGSTSAVVGTLAGTAGKTTYICGFTVSAIGGAADPGPVTIAGVT